MLCVIKTDFILDFIVYTGANTKLLDCDSNLEKSEAVVMTMIKLYLKKVIIFLLITGTLVQHYKWIKYKKKTHVSGTIRKDRKGMPTFTKKLKLADVEHRYTHKMLVTKWHDCRDIHMSYKI